MGKAEITTCSIVAGSQKSKGESDYRTRHPDATGKAPTREKATEPDGMAALVRCMAPSPFPLVNTLYAL